MFKRIISKQISHPSGLIGRYLLPLIWNKRNRVLNDFTLARLQLQAEDQVLEIGFGGGYLIGEMIENITTGHMSGVDVSDDILKHCRARFARPIKTGILDLQQAAVDALPYPNNHFSKACSVNSLFYWPDLHQGIREIHRVLAPNGLFILTYTSRDDLDKRGFSSQFVHSFKDEEVIDVLRKEGFRDVLSEQGQDEFRTFSTVTGRK
jgi:arsenite methyltransferase